MVNPKHLLLLLWCAILILSASAASATLFSRGDLASTNAEWSYPTIATASNGDLYMAWREATSGSDLIKVGKWSGTAWTPYASFTAANAGADRFDDYLSLAIDSGFRPHLVFNTVTGNTPGDIHSIRYATFSGASGSPTGSWTFRLVDDASDPAGQETLGRAAIALTAGDIPHIVYTYNVFSEPMSSYLRYAAWGGSSWTYASLEIRNGDSGYYDGQVPQIRVDGSGTDQILFTQGNSGLYCGTRTSGGVWTPASAIATGPNVHGSLTLDSSGNPSVAYYAGDSSGAATYTKKISGTWTTQASFSTPGTRGVNPIISLNAAGRVAIAYTRTDTNGNMLDTCLVHNASTTGTWFMERILQKGAVDDFGFLDHHTIGLLPGAAGNLVYSYTHTIANDARKVSFKYAAPSVSYPPTLGGITGGLAIGDKSTINPFSGATLSDPDSPGQTATVRIRISDTAKGSFTAASLTASGFTNQGGGLYQFVGNLAACQAAMRALVFLPVENHIAPTLTETTNFNVAVLVDDQEVVALYDNSANVVVTSINDAPAVTAGGSVSFTENGAAIAVCPGLTFSDPDVGQPNMAGATVVIATGFTSGDLLNFTNQNGITGSYNAGTGVLTLSGSSTRANYQAALRSITFATSSDNPTNYGANPSRTVQFQVNDGLATGAAASTTVNVAAVNDAPALTGGHTIGYTENAAGVAIDNTLTAADVDNQNLASATVAITAGLTSGDQLNFTNQGAITGSFNGATGVLTLSGSDTLANYQAALRSITYSSSSDDPTRTAASRTISFIVNDGSINSNTVSTTINVTAVNDAPVITEGANTTVNMDEDGTPAAFSLTLHASDAEGDTLTWSISSPAGHGTATASGTGASKVIGYTPNPNYNGTDAFTVTVNDGHGGATPFVVNVNLAAINDAPALTGGHTIVYTENATGVAIDNSLTASDVDNTNLASATVVIAADFTTGDQLNFINQNGITGSYNSGTGVLTLTGSATLANYQAALRSVTYSSTSDDPTVSSDTRTIAFQVSDGALNSNTVSTVIDINAVNDFPVLNAGGTVGFTENGTPVTLCPGLTLSDADNANLEWATVALVSASGYYPGDMLNFTNQNGITGSFSDGALILTGTSSKANYQAALRSITFSTNSDNPTNYGARPIRTIYMQISDGTGSSANSVITINMTAVNDAPALTGGRTIGYTEGGAGVVIDDTLTAGDADNTDLAGATVAIAAGFTTGDQLNFVNQNGITGSYNAGTGVLTLSGVSLLANYQAALRSVTYSSSSVAPTLSAASRTIAFQVSDGALSSNSVPSTVNITPVNDAPVLDGVGLSLPTINEDDTNPTGNSIAFLLTGHASDPDGTAVAGIAVIAADNSHGAWQYSLNGGTSWNNIGTVSASSALLLTQTNSRIRIVPAANQFGTLWTGLTYRAWDGTTGASGSTADTTTNGGTSAFSSATSSLAITVNPIGDTPQVASVTTDEDTLSGAIAVTPNAADGAEVTHFKITAITGGTLFQADGTTPVASGDFITRAQGAAGLRFMPSSNSDAAGHFSAEASQDGATVAAQSGAAVSTITINPIPDTPSTASITTNEDTLSGLIAVTPNAADGAEVTSFKISGISGGSLFLADGVTAVAEGAFITRAQGGAGLRFMPSLNSDAAGTFSAEASADGTSVSPQSAKAVSTITVNPIPDTPVVASVTTDEDTLSTSITISRNPADGPEAACFKISGITGGTLYQADGTTEIHDNDFITSVQATAGLRFLPAPNSDAAGSFSVESSADGLSVSPQSAKALSTITVSPVPDTPLAANATTLEDTLSSTITVLRNPLDGPEAAFFKISAITSGTLFQADGVTTVVEGAFISAAQGAAGLRFLPALNSNTTGTFSSESSADGISVSPQSAKALAQITIIPVNDPPMILDAPASQITFDEDTSLTVVLHASDADVYPPDFTGDHLTWSIVDFVASLSTPTTGTLKVEDYGTSCALIYTPAHDARGIGHFSAAVSDGQGGQTSCTINFHILNVNDPPVLHDRSFSVAENKPAMTKIGGIPASDVDRDDVYCDLVSGSGGEDNNLFYIDYDSHDLFTRVPLDFETRPECHIRVQARDNHGGYDTRNYTISVLDANDPPTAINLSNATVPENQPAGTQVGRLSAADEDLTDTHTFTLLPGQADNDAFATSGTQLLTARSFNYETTHTYTALVRADDGRGGIFDQALTIEITNLNETPVALDDLTSTTEDNRLTLPAPGVLANDGDVDAGDALRVTSATAVSPLGALAAIGPDGSLTYDPRGAAALQALAADQILTDTLRYTIADNAGSTATATVIVVVHGVNDPPLLIGGGMVSYLENDSPVVLDDDLITSDVDTPMLALAHVTITSGSCASDVLTCPATPGITAKYDPATADLLLSGTATLADYQAALRSVRYRSLSDNPTSITAHRLIRFKVSDGLADSNPTTVTVNITPENDPPVITEGSIINKSMDEDSTPVPFDLHATDAEGNPLHWSCGRPGNGGAHLVQNGNTCTVTYRPNENYNGQDSFQVHVLDGFGGGDTITVSVTIRPVNDPPGPTMLSNTIVAENQPAGTLVGQLSATDPDTSDTRTFSLVPGAPFDGGNPCFTIRGTQLLTTATLDFETTPTLYIRVRVTDAAGAYREDAFLIHVLDANDPPSDLRLSNNDIFANAPIGTEVGQLTSVDQDPSDTHTYSLVTGTGDSDNALFTIQGSTLSTKAALPSDTRPLNIRIQTDDGRGGKFAKPFVITRHNWLADLSLGLSVVPTTATTGSPLMIHLNAANTSPVDTQDTVVTVTLPSQVQFDSLSGIPQTSMTQSGNTCVLNLGTFAGGSSLAPALGVRFNPSITTLTAPLVFNARISTSGPNWIDPDLANNATSATANFVRPTGSITIQPSVWNAPWILTGPGFPGSGERTIKGIGTKRLDGMPFGRYSIVWGDLEGWINPGAYLGILNSVNGITLDGTYIPNSPATLSMSVPTGYDYKVGDPMRIRWTSNVRVTGTAVRFELWTEGRCACTLATDWSAGGQGEKHLLVPGIAAGTYRLRIVSSWNPVFWVENPNNIEISGDVMTVTIPPGGHTFVPGQQITVAWFNAVSLVGEEVKLELWNNAGFVADVGFDWDPAGQGTLTYTLPQVPTGNYWIRSISVWNPLIYADSHDFVKIRGRNAADPSWTKYE